jgi:hypothetical protein
MDALKNSYRASLESILGGWSAAIAGGMVVVLAAFAALLFASCPRNWCRRKTAAASTWPSTGQKARATTTSRASA